MTSKSKIRNSIATKRKLVENAIFFIEIGLNPHSKLVFVSSLLVFFSTKVRKITINKLAKIIEVLIILINVINYCSLLLEITCTFILFNLLTSPVNSYIQK